MTSGMATNYKFMLKAGTYTLNGGKTNIAVEVVKSDGVSIASTSIYKTFTIDEDTEVFVRLNISKGKTVNEIIKPMLEEGSIPHDYVPYGSWLKVKDTGKNKLEFVDGAYSHNGITAVVKDAIITLNGTETATSFITINNVFNYTFKANQKYTIGFNNKTLISNTGAKFRFSKNGGNEVVKDFYFNNINSSQTFYFTKDTEVEWIQIRTGVNITYDNFIIKPQLEKGSTATEYEPYQEQSTLIDMNKYDDNDNIIGNYELCSIDNTKDELNIDKDGNVSIKQNIGEVVLNGSESGWGKNYVSSGVPQFFISLPNCITQSKLISTHFINTNKEDKLYINKYEQLVIINPFNNDTLLVEWKTWLSTHPVTIKYVLAEPQTISLGKITSLKLLEGTNNITTNDELQPNMTSSINCLNLVETSLRNIKANDYLNNKTIHLSFPFESYENIDNTEHIFIIINENLYFCYKPNHPIAPTAKHISYKYKGRYNFIP